MLHLMKAKFNVLKQKVNRKSEQDTPPFELQILDRGNEIDNHQFEVEPENLQVSLEQEPKMREDQYDENTDLEHIGDEDTLRNYQLTRDRERRTIRSPNMLGFSNYISYVFLNIQDLSENKPRTYEEAINSENKKAWKKVMEEKKMKSLEQNKTWELVPKSKNKTISIASGYLRLKNETQRINL